MYQIVIQNTTFALLCFCRFACLEAVPYSEEHNIKHADQRNIILGYAHFYFKTPFM